MSGGAFNYLYCDDTEDFFERTDDLEEMKEILEKHGYKNISKDVNSLILFIKDSIRFIDEKCEELRPIFKAIEYNIEKMKDAIERFESGNIGKEEMYSVFDVYLKRSSNG